MPGSSWTENTVTEVLWIQNTPVYPGQEQTATAAPMGMGAQLISQSFEQAESSWSENTVPSGTNTEVTVPAAATWSKVGI